jgi:hypothetical protein
MGPPWTFSIAVIAGECVALFGLVARVLVLASRRPAWPSLLPKFCQPRRWAPTTRCSADRETFETEDRFLQLLMFLAQFRQDLADVHYPSKSALPEIQFNKTLTYSQGQRYWD